MKPATTAAVALLNLGLGTAVLLRVDALRWGSLAPLVAVVVPSVLLLLRTPGVLTSWPQGELTEIVFFEEGNLATVHVRADPLAPKRLGMAIDGTIIGVSPV